MNSNKSIARTAGFWYLLVAIFGALNTMFVESKLSVISDPAETVNYILASEGLFRIGILSSLITTVCFLFLANALYKLFKTVDKDQVRLMVIFIIASVPIAYLSILKFAPLIFADKTAYSSAFDPAQLNMLSMIFRDLFRQGFNIVYIFYGLWLFPLGLLVYKSRSGFITKTVGILLMVGCFGYLINFVEFFFALDFGRIPSLWMNFTIFAEVLCILWLFLVGPKNTQQVLGTTN
jgi:hypothetical protein